MRDAVKENALALFVYVTTPDAQCAERIARDIVARRLAACANILPGARSLYWWNGAVECADETVLVAKTEEDRFDDLARAIRDLHPYVCPCITAMPILRSTPDFLAWIRNETRPE
jgi:periplasmic divalent cation tolerance protein